MDIIMATETRRKRASRNRDCQSRGNINNRTFSQMTFWKTRSTHPVISVIPFLLAFQEQFEAKCATKRFRRIYQNDFSACDQLRVGNC